MTQKIHLIAQRPISHIVQFTIKYCTNKFVRSRALYPIKVGFWVLVWVYLPNPDPYPNTQITQIPNPYSTPNTREIEYKYPYPYPYPNIIFTGWVKIIFNENFYRIYPILWAFGYGYGFGRYTHTQTPNSWFFSIKLWFGVTS